MLITAAAFIAGIPAATSPVADPAAPAASTVPAGRGTGPPAAPPSSVFAGVLQGAQRAAEAAGAGAAADPRQAAAVQTGAGAGPQQAAALDAGAAQPSSISAVDARGQMALRFALAQRGKPYVYGGTGPNAYDCSGLTQRAWSAAGVKIPRTTQQQARTGKAVPLSAIKPGDLVIFYADASHVGIYAGNGQVVVAPHAGEVVMLQQMKWMPINTVRRPG